MTAEFSEVPYSPTRRSLRLETLINIRWLAVLGQTAAVLTVWLFLDFEFHPTYCLLLIAASAFLNAFLTIRHTANTRLSERSAVTLLLYDIVQMALLLFLTGGLGNPFSYLLLVPVFISATALSVSSTVLLGVIALGSASLLTFYHLPLPWTVSSGLDLPRVYIAGMWFAIASSLLFTAVYAFRVANEARQLADALSATELVLQREQHLTNIDGLAAAAAHELGTPLATISLVSKEMLRDLDTDSELYEDVKLVRSQADRCREIMRTLTSLSSEGDQHIGIIRLPVILEEVSQPHRNFGVEVSLEFPRENDELYVARNPGMLYGLGNLVENAVDHARSKVVLEADWDENDVRLVIRDDGPGFDSEMIPRIGDPFLNSRSTTKRGGGLGLGLFIAKTLLERSGASIQFRNASASGTSGAIVQIRWPRPVIEAVNSH